MEELYKKFNYPSLEKFKIILKNHNVPYTNKEVNEFIENQVSFQLHKTTNNKRQNLKFIVAREPFEMLQIDLLDYQKYSMKNKGFHYVLIAIDIFSRFAFATPIKHKTPADVLEGFKSFDVIPKAIFHDSGNEYKGVFLQYINEKEIVDLKANIGDHNSLGIVDRFSKTLKTIIAKFMTENKTTTFYNHIDDIIDAYNNSPHASLGNNAPIEVFKDKNVLQFVKQINWAKTKYNMSLRNKNINKIKVGDNVRKKIKKNLFKKGYEITFSKEVYKVEKIDGENAELDDGTIENVKNLMITNNAIDIDTTEKDEDDLNAKVKRKLQREGLL